MVAALARWCVAHRRLTVAGWLLALAVALGAAAAIGSHYSNSSSLKGTESQRAVDLLRSQFPAQAGDNDQIVIHVVSGGVTAPDVRARVSPVLARVARLPHVTAVLSPFTRAGTAQVSRGRTTAFATVLFDKRANDLPIPAVKAVMATAEAARARGLEIELGGLAIEQAEGVPVGPATVVGLAAAVVVLLVTFGSLAATGLPIVTALFGLGSAFGVIVVTSRLTPMPDISTELAAMIGLGVGIDYALFIVTRFREGYRASGDAPMAVLEAMGTSGRAVLFAGVTVIAALLGMLVLGVGFMNGMAIAGALAVLATMLATLTLLPALLARFGPRIARSRVPAAAATPPRQTVSGGFWARWARLIHRRPWPAGLAGLAIMLVIAAPVVSMRLGLSDQGNDPASQTTYQAYRLLKRGFGPGFNGPLLIVASLPHTAGATTLTVLTRTLRSAPDVATVTRPRVSPSGRTVVYEAFPRSAPQSLATTTLVHTLRERVLPPLARVTGATMLVGGPTAGGIDFTAVIAGKLPVFVAIVVALAAALLLAVFGSLVIPLQAAAMNLLSIGAALGVTVAVFQKGWLARLLGITPGPIDPWLPVMLFAIVFGLSMDYEVFLISRIREEWLRRRDASTAIAQGLISTGRVITAAAAIMIAVFLSFVLGADRQVKLFGLSLASAVFLDAFVIRSLLLPATLELLGRATLTLPRWLAERLPRTPVQAAADPAVRPNVAVGD